MGQGYNLLISVPAPNTAIGIIGCGRAALDLHLPALSRIPGVHIAGLADLVPSRLPDIGAARHRDYRDLLADPHVDVVLIAAPTPVHHDLFLAAAEAGKHIYVEKPLALDLEQADCMTTAAALYNIKVVAGFNLRSHRLVLAARDRIRSGALGPVVAIRTVFAAGGGQSAWQLDRRQGGGAAYELGSHHFDLWRFLLDSEAGGVSASGVDDDTVSVAAHFTNGAVANSILTLRGTPTHQVEVIGERACLRFSLYHADSFEMQPTGRIAQLANWLSQLPEAVRSARRGGDYRDSYRVHWCRFLESLQGGDPPATLDDGRESLRVCTEALATLARPVLVAASDGREAPESSEAPALSVILVTPDTSETLRLTLRYLRAQSARDRIELILVGPSEAALQMPEEDLAAFWGQQTIAIGPVTSIARANAAGVRAARSPLVALAEDHCFPEPGWAEALIDAHRGSAVVVGPSIRNANPGTIVSQCDFVVGYGPWMDPVPAGAAAFLPGHNSCYKKSVLLELGDRLEEMMEAETVLHFDFVRQGRELRIEPAARAAHTNFALASSWLPVMFCQGRVFGASRARSWTLSKRLAYAAASPLIPMVRLVRCLRELAKPGRPKHSIPRLLPMLTFGLALDGLGQMLGYLLGPGEAVERVARFEYRRFDHVTEEDRIAAEAQAPV